MFFDAAIELSLRKKSKTEKSKMLKIYSGKSSKVNSNRSEMPSGLALYS